MPSWTDIIEISSALIYFYVEYCIWKSKNRIFHSPFYRLFLLIGVLDLIAFVLYRIKPFFSDSPPARTILGMGTKMMRDGHFYLDVALSANRFTATLYPVDHSVMWRKENFRRIIAFIGFLIILSQSYTPVLVILYGWKDQFMGYSQIYMFDAYHRLFYAILVIVPTSICLIMNVVTLVIVRKSARTCQWSHLIFSVASTIISIPLVLFQIGLSYASFTENDELEAMVFANNTWVFLCTGYYQPFWLLTLSAESRRECVRWIGRLGGEGHLSLPTEAVRATKLFLRYVGGPTTTTNCGPVRRVIMKSERRPTTIAAY